MQSTGEGFGQSQNTPFIQEGSLNGKRVAVIVSDGFEQSEFDGPTEALRQAGATVEVLAEDQAHLQHIAGVHHLEKGPGTKGTKLLSEIRPEDYDLLLVPGGLASPDKMRQSQAHLDLVKAFVTAGKPTALICHGPWLLADADVAQGRKVTSWPGIKRDLQRAGAEWVDEQVVRDRNLVTSRKPADIPAFSKAIVDLLVESGRPAEMRR
jgi:protease I